MVKGGVSRAYVKMLICIPMIRSLFITNIKQEKRAEYYIHQFTITVAASRCLLIRTTTLSVL